ncbi:MAG: toll/interleukin-1 receptor domain-containing protein [Halobacteriota archaeon]
MIGKSVAPSRTIRVFISYSHNDEALKNELEKYLDPLIHDGLIAPWQDRNIAPGADFENEIERRLETSDIILLLITPDFLASDYIFSKELFRAMELHDEGKTCVIPIICRVCRWNSAPFGKLQVLPKDGKPIAKWDDRDEAFYDIITGIEKSVNSIIRQKSDISVVTKESIENALKVFLPNLCIEGDASIEEVYRLLKLNVLQTLIEKNSQLLSEIKVFLDTFENKQCFSPENILPSYQTGERAYYSEEFETFRRIGRHFERLGVLVRFGYIDINVVFEIIVFPDDFWEKTSKLRNVLKEKWWGEDHPLADFWKNFTYLHKKYVELRNESSSEVVSSNAK